MNYYIMLEKRTDELQIRLGGCPEIVKQGIRFDSGVKMKSGFSKITHEYESGPYHYFLGDSVVAPGFKGLLFNKKTFDLLKSLGVTNTQYLDVELIDTTQNIVHKNYFLINIVGHFDIVDYEKSELTFYNSGNIEFIDSLAMRDISGMDLPSIFRMSKFLPLVVVNETIKEAFEANNITGLRFYDFEGYEL